ncbi:hypothetical protein VNO77_16730 [Canavalia gladiata]|uniref:Uncharacterized protein n=1 Tax=Canavalia gladiata TaxID=3824 RepID=A0AAN9LHX2_CANGL
MLLRYQNTSHTRLPPLFHILVCYTAIEFYCPSPVLSKRAQNRAYPVLSPLGLPPRGGYFSPFMGCLVPLLGFSSHTSFF